MLNLKTLFTISSCWVLSIILSGQISSPKNEKYSAYLFVHFCDSQSDEESIFYSLSYDGINYKKLNSGHPILLGKDISSEGGVRDPHILRGVDGKFYMAVTDMYARNGWDSNHGIVLLKSDDLINWTHSKIDIKIKFPAEFGNIIRVWAPQTIFDEKKGKYMIYFSMKEKGNFPDIIYYAYVNKDFNDLETVPKQLFYHPQNNSCIDGDIIFKDGKYHLFFKTEGNGNGIKQAVSDNLTNGYVLHDKYLQQTEFPVEGACVFKLIGQEKYILMYDVYRNKKYEYTESNDLENFFPASHPFSMDFIPRHGTVIQITGKEAERLIKKWPTSSAQ